MDRTPLPLHLAPMAGITDWPFRLLCRQMGADVTVTEMISAQGFLTAPKASPAYGFLMAVSPLEGPVTAQLFGHEPRYFSEAIKRIHDLGLYAGIDINMGCPAPKVTGSGSGSALMKAPDLARQIIKAARTATQLPLSVKMRIGWDEGSINAVPFARMLEAEGADLITVHGRTRSQQYAGKADWATIALVKGAVKVPVIANGDVFCAADARAILEVTGCDGIAIGRGALGNPWLFQQIKQALAGEALSTPTPAQVLSLALHHALLMAGWKGEESAVIEMRKHFAWYMKGMRGAAAVRRELNDLAQLGQVEDLLRGFMRQALPAD
ncbi:MAG: tRNA dihydrouridine synthase DusB [Christensenellales bacterium]